MSEPPASQSLMVEITATITPLDDQWQTLRIEHHTDVRRLIVRLLRRQIPFQISGLADHRGHLIALPVTVDLQQDHTLLDDVLYTLTANP